MIPYKNHETVSTVICFPIATLYLAATREMSPIGDWGAWLGHPETKLDDIQLFLFSNESISIPAKKVCVRSLYCSNCVFTVVFAGSTCRKMRWM
jgi:hypothetical protein